MARTVFEDPVRELHGAYTKGGSISRRKTYRDSKGRIKGMSEPETYKIGHPRDWKKNPAKGKELEHQLRFKQACAETHRILLPSKPQAYAAAHATDLMPSSAPASSANWNKCTVHSFAGYSSEREILVSCAVCQTASIL